MERIIKLEREPYSDRVTLIYENGESDLLDAEKARIKLRALGVKDPDKPLDHVWNFYKCTIKLTDDAL